MLGFAADRYRSPEQRAAEEIRFRELSHVYEILFDSSLRAQYDESRSRCPGVTQPPPPRAPLNSDELTVGDWYAILGVPITATQQDIKTAYRRASLQYYPGVQSDAEIRGRERFYRQQTRGMSHIYVSSHITSLTGVHPCRVM